jgi:hypothetical protein
MLATNEPRDGDFVAYLEQLQRESAARLLVQAKSQMTQLPASAARPDHASPGAPTTAMPRLAADELLGRLTSPRASAALVLPTLGIFFGGALLLHWLTKGSTLLSLLIGIGLVIWSVRRLRRVAIERAAPRATSQTLVSQVFGKPPGA